VGDFGLDGARAVDGEIVGFYAIDGEGADFSIADGWGLLGWLGLGVFFVLRFAGWMGVV